MFTTELRLTESNTSNAPLVSAIVVNHNRARDLETCLPTLLDQSYPNLEIIVADNASTDHSRDVARALGVRWLPLSTNVGLGPALNKGAAAAGGALLLFLNNDMRFHPSCVESMVSVLMEDPKIFSVDAIQYNWGGDKRVHVATRLTKAPRAETSYAVVPALHVYQEDCDRPTAVVMSSAANMLARREMFEALGGFDERLLFGYEDIELCWRAWTRGWKTVLAPSAICWHRVGGSSQSKDAARMAFRGILSGRLLMATKLMPFKYLIGTWAGFAAGLARDGACLRHSEVADRVAVLRAYLASLAQLVRERQEIYWQAGIGPSDQLECLLQLGGNAQ